MIRCNVCNNEKDKSLFRIKKVNPLCFDCFNKKNRENYRIKNPKVDNLCKECGLQKDKSEFIKNTNCCKDCKKLYRRKHYESNKSNYIEYSKNLSKTEKRKRKQKEYQENNKGYIREYQRVYRENNKESIKKKRKEYNITRKERHKERYSNDINYKIKVIHRNLLRSVIKRLKLGPKKERTNKILGYTHMELKKHIESLFTEGMSWENYGEWHIDHIKPISLFEIDTPSSVVNSLSNLQPLWAIDNLRKNNKQNGI